LEFDYPCIYNVPLFAPLFFLTLIAVSVLVQDIEVLSDFIIVSVSKLEVHVYTLISTWLRKACEVAL